MTYQCDHCGYKFPDNPTYNGMHRCPSCRWLTEATPLDEDGNPIERYAD